MNRFARLTAVIATEVGRRLTDLGAWVAGFTFWRFALLSLLILFAVNLTESVLFGGAATEAHRITVLAEADPDAAATAAESDPVETDGEEGRGKKSKGCDTDIRLGGSGVEVKKRCAGSAPANRAALAGEAAIPVAAETHGKTDGKWIDLNDLAWAGLAILWVVWFASRARLQAEARVERAEDRAERESLERQVAEARLQALQAQVEPHFLFNTLAAVEHLIETDPPRAGVMQRHLIAFLRGAMPRLRGAATTLGDEFELCRNYLAIMKIRLEDRLDYSMELAPDMKSLPFPAMMLQPLVENAIKHGIEPKADGGSVRVSARIGAGRLRVTVADSGLGFAAAATAGTGIGLNNLRERLISVYGVRAALDIAPNAPTGTQATIEIPHETGDRDHC